MRLDATFVKCREGGHVASVAVVTAIACDERGMRHVPGFDVVDTESHDSWLGFLRGPRGRGVGGVRLAVSDALACLDFPPSHRRRLRTNSVRERTSREMKRRSRVVQVSPSRPSPMRLAGAVMADVGEGWRQSRCFSAARVDELWRLEEARRGGPSPARPSRAELEAARAEADKIPAAAEVAMEGEAAQDSLAQGAGAGRRHASDRNPDTPTFPTRSHDGSVEKAVALAPR